MTSRSAGAVVFDCDGVLADTVSCWNAAFRSVGRLLGLTLSTEQLNELSGASVVGASDLMGRWANDRTSRSVIVEALNERLLQAIGEAELSPLAGVPELLHTLEPVVPMAVASNAPRGVLHGVLDRLQLCRYFTVIVSADDAAFPKPAPDPYLAACAGLEVDPLLSFAVEDSLTGMTSAAAAGLAVIEVASNAQSPVAALHVASLTDPRLVPFIVEGRMQVRNHASRRTLRD